MMEDAQMEDCKMSETISTAKKDFGIKCKKFAGAVTVEVIKHNLENHGILTSPRDVFIRGLPIEVDLLIPKRGTIPEYGILYEPQDLLVVLEVKNYGSFGESTINNVKKNFERIRELNREIYCAYVTITERKGYKWAISEKNIGFPSYTLSWHHGSGKDSGVERTGDWKRLLDDINGVTRSGLNRDRPESHGGN
jgi:hypothetical protein